MSGTTHNAEQQDEWECLSFTQTTLAERASDHASSIPAWQRSIPLRDVLKSMGEATASGHSISQVHAKVLEMAWKSKLNTNPTTGDEILDWNLQYTQILIDCDNLESVTFPPPGLADLESKKSFLQNKKWGKLCSTTALLYLRKRGPQSLQMANHYLHLALETYLNSKYCDRASLIPIAQDLADVLELQGNIGLESDYFQDETKIPRWIAKEVILGRMALANQWCESNEFEKDQFYEVNKKHGLSPLEKSVKFEHREEFTAMLRFTARTVTSHRMSSIASKLLLLAADTCNSDYARDLLECGAMANTLDDHGRTSLHRLLLCRKFGDSGGFKMMKLLLESDTSILDIQDENGKTALTLACEAEYIRKTDEFLKHGANPNILDNHERSPFFIACSKGCFEMIKVFIANDKSGRSKIALEINALGPSRETPLIAAVRFAGRGISKDTGAIDAIKLLVQHGADSTHKDSEKRKNIEGKIITAPETGEPSIPQTSHAKIVEDGAALRIDSDDDKTTGSLLEEQTSDDLDDDTLDWESNDSVEDPPLFPVRANPVNLSILGGASGLRQCPNQNTYSNHEGPFDITSPASENHHHGIPASGSGPSDEMNSQNGSTQAEVEVAEEPADASGPASLSNSLENVLQMHDNQHGAAYIQSPPAPQNAASPTSISANGTLRFPQTPIPTLNHIQQSRGPLYSSLSTRFVGPQPGYHPLSSHTHYDINSQANLTAPWPIQIQQSVPGSHLQAQGFQAADDIFLADLHDPAAFLGDTHLVSSFSPGIWNNPAYNSGQPGVSVQQGLPLDNAVNLGTSPMYRRNHNFQVGMQGPSQTDPQRSSSGNQNIQAAGRSGANDVAM
ncbi:uncharacterized protein JN550_001148 [Neoarthrinium moseri]|uniref:uncharacterized protein n=1 Tax=Neoarthrinium moseri TaxID=1658444 RepID=UPI001FDB0CD7|nr:uncharacterized protein JN550_001148 [Neoarthrinium moseri]KAI1877076.1 hypothetical protein JN550_001148 [Neoarthrinium moseri]